jgi:hypothetical protein
VSPTPGTGSPVADTATAVLQDMAAPVLPPTPTAVATASPVRPVVAEPEPLAAAGPDEPPDAVWVTMPEPPVWAPMEMEPPKRVSPLDAWTRPVSPDRPCTRPQPPSPL